MKNHEIKETQAKQEQEEPYVMLLVEDAQFILAQTDTFKANQVACETADWFETSLSPFELRRAAAYFAGYITALDVTDDKLSEVVQQLLDASC